MGTTMLVLSVGAICWELYEERKQQDLYEAEYYRKRFLEQRDIVSKEIYIQRPTPEAAPNAAPEAAPNAAPNAALAEAALAEAALAEDDIAEDVF